MKIGRHTPRNFIGVVLASACFFLSGSHVAQAQCVLPNQLAGSQVADASQMMANFNALVRCIAAASPAGSANAIQYNASSGTSGAVDPLTNGQVVIGSTGTAPQANRLEAGPGIAITNGAGSITIEASGSGTGAGLYRDLISATPTSAGTGLTTWLNQGTAAVSDSAVGVCIDSPTSGAADNVAGRYMAAPTPPYTITALIAATTSTNRNAGVGIGWYDGTAKLHILNYASSGGSIPLLQVAKFSSPTVFNGVDFSSAANNFSQPVWLRIGDDGTNVSFAFSQDGASFLPLFSIAKSAGYLGAAGYSNLIFTVNPQGGRTLGTLMSWKVN